MTKWLFSMVLVLALTIFSPVSNSIVGHAEEITSITDPKKSWSITFNQDVQESSVTEESVKIVDEQQNQLAVSRKVEGKKITVTPTETYSVNKIYTLIITNSVVSKKNKSLKKETTKRFMLKASNKMGEPTIAPSTTVAVSSSPNLFYATVKLDVQTPLAIYNELAKESSVILSVKNTDGTWQELGYLFDNGNLEESKDEIKGDGYFSIDLSQYVDTSTIGKQEYQIKAAFENGESLVKNFSINVVDSIKEESILAAKSDIQEVMMELEEGASTPSIFKEQLVSKLQANHNVQNVVASDSAIEVTFESGVKNIINLIKSADVSGLSKVKSKAIQNPDTIEDGDVLIWSPRTTGYKFSGVGSEKYSLYAEAQKEMFNKSGVGYSVHNVTGRWATIDALKTMTNYGTVILNADSFLDKWLSTGEEQLDTGMYLVEQTNGEMATVQNVYIEDGYVDYYSDPYYVVNEKWFENNLNGKFENSLIYNSSDNLGQTSAYWDVFASKGAGAYVGINGKLDDDSLDKSAYSFFENFIENQTLGEALIGGAIKGYGNLDLKYDIKWVENSLVNGDFEAESSSSNKVPGWNYVGDGRVLSSLGNLVYPTQGNQMGLISTGLGFTENLGEIAQTFKVNENANTLSFDWNYLSEEFLEYIGSGYDDPFVVTLETLDGSYSEKVLDLSVNKLAEQFGAGYDGYYNAYYDEETDEYYDTYKEKTGGELIHVSPSIKFDDGDVWMTNWQHKDFTLPQEVKGKLVRLVFSAQDAQDSILDTVVLIDNVQVK